MENILDIINNKLSYLYDAQFKSIENNNSNNANNNINILNYYYNNNINNNISILFPIIITGII